MSTTATPLSRRTDPVFSQMTQMNYPSYTILLRSVLTLYVSTSKLQKKFSSFIVMSKSLKTFVTYPYCTPSVIPVNFIVVNLSS